MATNQFKSGETKQKVESKTKKKKRNVSSVFSKPILFLTSLKDNEKLTKSIGLILLGFSAFLLLAFSSFLFTWKIDQDLINNHWGSPEIQVENWGGKFGAYLSHQFIFNGFGIAAFLFIFLTFILGFRILFKTTILPLGKSFKYSIFSLLWLSITLNYLLPNTPILGGAFGFQANLWFASIIGNIGVGLILVISLLMFLVFNFNISFSLLNKLMPKDADEDEKIIGNEDELSEMKSRVEDVPVIIPVEELTTDKMDENAPFVYEESQPQLENELKENLTLQVDEGKKNQKL